MVAETILLGFWMVTEFFCHYQTVYCKYLHCIWMVTKCLSQPFMHSQAFQDSLSTILIWCIDRFNSVQVHVNMYCQISLFYLKVSEKSFSIWFIMLATFMLLEITILFSSMSPEFHFTMGDLAFRLQCISLKICTNYWNTWE